VVRASPLAAINLIITVIKSIGILIKYTVKPEHLLGVLKHLAGGMQSGMQRIANPLPCVSMRLPPAGIFISTERRADFRGVGVALLGNAANC
jgi:hypothetical protein